MDQIIFNWAVAVAGVLGGWVLKVIWDSLQTLRAEIKQMDSKMHEDFVRRDDFKDAMTDVHLDITEIKNDMKDGFKSLNGTLSFIFKKLEGNPVMEPLEGYHANIRKWEGDFTEEQLAALPTIDKPEHPVRIWAGD